MPNFFEIPQLLQLPTKKDKMEYIKNGESTTSSTDSSSMNKKNSPYISLYWNNPIHSLKDQAQEILGQCLYPQWQATMTFWTIVMLILQGLISLVVCSEYKKTKKFEKFEKFERVKNDKNFFSMGLAN